MTTPTSETSRLLSLGEGLRENPDTILLSLPVLVFCIFWFSLSGQSEFLSGAYGHLGLTFKLLYKHHFKNKNLLKIAYRLFNRAFLTGAGNSAPTVKMKLGETAMELGHTRQAIADLKASVTLARHLHDLPQTAYAMTNLGRAQIIAGDLSSAKTNLDQAVKIFHRTITTSSPQRLHIWYCAAEIGLAEYYLAKNNRKFVVTWLKRAKSRAADHSLNTRLLDIDRLYQRVNL